MNGYIVGAYAVPASSTHHDPAHTIVEVRLIEDDALWPEEGTPVVVGAVVDVLTEDEQTKRCLHGAARGQCALVYPHPNMDHVYPPEDD